MAKLLEFLSLKSSASSFSLRELSEKAGLISPAILPYLQALVKEELIRVRVGSCEHCGFELDISDIKIDDISLGSVECPQCGNITQFMNSVLFESVAGISQDKLNAELDKVSYDRSARIIAEKLDLNKRIGYIVCDISKSQRMQKQSPQEYTNLLAKTRKDLWPSALRKALSPYLVMLSNGDQTNLAFSEPMDALGVVWEFYKNSTTTGARFSCVINSIEKLEDGSAQEYLKQNLYNRWDLNLYEVTIAHRVLDACYHEDIQWDENTGEPLTPFKMYVVVDNKLLQGSEYFEIFSKHAAKQITHDHINVKNNKDAINHTAFILG